MVRIKDIARVELGSDAYDLHAENDGSEMI